MPISKFGRNEPCWCGSGKKYKHCHLNRESLPEFPVEKFLQARKKKFTKRYCLHPKADLAICRGDIVEAHSITKNGGLSKIAENGHVYSCMLHSRSPFMSEDPTATPNRVGIGVASTFTGFCKYHDNSTFGPLEKTPFVGSNEQVFLLEYRAVAHELFLKKADFELTPVQRELDRGKSPEFQREYQDFLSTFKSGVVKAIEDLDEIKSLHDYALIKKDYSELRSYIIEFRQTPDILCNAITQPDIDFSGNRLQRLDNLELSAEWLHFSLIATEKGGAAVFSWLGKSKVCERFIRSLDSYADRDIPHAIVRFTFEFFENTYFSPTWWNGLDKSMQTALMQRQFRHDIHPDRCLQDDQIKAVKWSVVSRTATGL